MPFFFRYFIVLRLALPLGLLLALPISNVSLFVNAAQASALPSNDGSVILRMCKGAGRVKALSVMCHSYLNGYIDAAHLYAKGKPTFCLATGDKEKSPDAIVAWIEAHPDSLRQPAGAVLQRALSEQFPCTGKR